MKNIIATAILSLAATSTFAADMVSGDVEFFENVPRVCGIKVDGDVGSIKFKGEEADEVAAHFSVTDNGEFDQRTEITVDTKNHSANLIDPEIKYSINETDGFSDPGTTKTVSTGVTHPIYVGVMNISKVDAIAGDAKVTATITVSCGN